MTGGERLAAVALAKGQIDRIQTRCDELLEKLRDEEGVEELIEKTVELKMLGQQLEPDVRPPMDVMKKLYPLLIDCLNACIKYGIIENHQPWVVKKELLDR